MIFSVFFFTFLVGLNAKAIIYRHIMIYLLYFDFFAKKSSFYYQEEIDKQTTEIPILVFSKK